MGKNGITLWVLIFIALLVAFAVAFCLIFSYEMNALPQEPSEYVKNITVENSNGVMYKEKIIRYPAKGDVIPLLLNGTIKVGVSVDKSQLDFGVIPKGLNVNKGLDFTNTDYATAKVRVVTYGNIKPFIKGDDNLIIKPGENKSLGIMMNATDIGQYSGEVDIIMRVPGYQPLGLLLEHGL